MAFTPAMYAFVGFARGMFLPANAPSLIPLEFYCDSSSHRGHNFMAAGGLAIRKSRYADIDAAVQQVKDTAGIRSELKWSEYRGGARRKAFEAVVDLCFLLVREKQAALHFIIS